MKLPRTNHHVTYEFNMLKLCYDATQNFGDYFGTQQKFLFNCFHESFCVHAWNLIKWFEGDEWHTNSEIEPYMSKIKEQILSLGGGRTTELERKLGSPERTFIYEWIMKNDSAAADNSPHQP